MLEEKTWEEFRNAGMLFLANTILQFFGWSIVIELEMDKIKVYPIRTKFRGFSLDCVEEGHKKVASFLINNVEELYKEAVEE